MNRDSFSVESQAEKSYEDSRSFFLELFEEARKKYTLPSHSVPFESYQWYHDCVVRHLNQNGIAFRSWEKEGWREWSYDSIHRLVNYQVNRWRNQQEDWTGNVAIAMPLGIHFIVGVLTAIRLGLTFTALPLDSPLLPTKRLRTILDQVSVSLLFTTPEASSTIPGKERHWLIEYLEESDKYEPEKDTIYKPEDPFQMAYACQQQHEPALIFIGAEEAYLNALRDGALTLDLGPGIVFGYSPDCSLREQPHLLLTALLSGSTTVILPRAKLQENPELVRSQPIQVLGITRFLQKLWTQHEGIPKSKLTNWVYNLFDDDEKAWSLFIQKNFLEKIPAKRLIVDNAGGGIPVASIRVQDEAKDHLWPSFGTKWELLQYGQQEVPSVHTYGVFKQGSSPSNLFLTKQRVGWEIVDAVTPQTRGYTIPIAGLELAIKELDFVDFTFFLTLPVHYSPLSTQRILLIFVSPLLWEEIPKNQDMWKSAVNQEIAKTWGAPFVPDKVEFFPLVPNQKEGVLDRNWCSHQYTSGLLHRKKSMKVYHWLSLLKKSASISN